MVALETPAAEIGWQAVDFELKGTDGQVYNLAKAKGENGLVVMFICNHCPFVKAIMSKIIRDANELKQHGVNCIAIMSNDAETYPEDSFENMQKLDLPFPYVIDEDQSIAKTYDAVCTPDFFGLDGDLKLQYRGRLDDSGMQDKADGERDLFAAMLEVAQTGKSSKPQLNSIGCSIKWK